MSEKDLETLKRKYSVVRHQISLLYKDYIEESKAWKSEKENLLSSIKKLNDVINVDAVKLQEYSVTYFFQILIGIFILNFYLYFLV